MKKWIKRGITAALLSIPASTSVYAAYGIPQAKEIPLDLPLYQRFPIGPYPVFFLQEYVNTSKEMFGRFPIPSVNTTYQEHIAITDAMMFDPRKYGFDSDEEWDLATMQRHLGMKVGDGDKVKGLFRN